MLTDNLCQWSPTDPQDLPGVYDTTCNHTFAFTDDGPAENGFIFCPFCGGRILAVTLDCQQEEDEDADE
jgi:hypothetical protein